MSKIDLNIPDLGNKFIDIRDTIPGDSFNWSWVRLLSGVKYLAIHHSASPDTQTPDEIANYHIKNNGWGGIGYHFLIGKDGTVYYVGDISTARANVANLNEQVIGICLIGNFTSGRIPTSEQLDSCHKLCYFFINNYPDLSNLISFDSVLGHKDLPGQSTICPGDSWPSWRVAITQRSNPLPLDRAAQIIQVYKAVLGRDPDIGGLQTYINGPMSVDQIIISMVNSKEHSDLIALAKESTSLRSQVDSLQTSLASVNQQLITLSENLQEREKEISDLKATILQSNQANIAPHTDTTLTIIGALSNLYTFIFPPQKAE